MKTKSQKISIQKKFKNREQLIKHVVFSHHRKKSNLQNNSNSNNKHSHRKRKVDGLAKRKNKLKNEKKC